MPFDFAFITVILLVIYLEGVLSIDNAAVLGALVSALPPEEIVPWPRLLRFLAQPVHKLLGGQRSAALKVGILGAYAGQAIMLLLANIIIQNPWLKLLGGLYLIKLALENLGEPEPGEEAQVDSARVSHRSFWGVVLAVEFTDLAFSLDNVVAVVALSRDIRVIMFGVAMAIVMLRFAAGIFTRLILIEPILKTAAYIVVLNIGIELWLDELFNVHIENIHAFIISLSTLIIAVAYARVPGMKRLQPVFYWLGEGLANVNELFDWALKPITGLARLLLRGLGALANVLHLPFTSETRHETLIRSEGVKE